MSARAMESLVQHTDVPVVVSELLREINISIDNDNRDVSINWLHGRLLCILRLLKGLLYAVNIEVGDEFLLHLSYSNDKEVKI